MHFLSTRLLPLTFVLIFPALPVLAAESIQGALTANPTGEISILVTRGEVRVVGVDGNEVSVTGTRDHQSEEFIFERTGDVVQIEDRLPKRTRSGPGTMITVEVPRGSRVRTQLVSADLEVSELAGPARLSTVSGSVRMSGSGDETEISSVSGSISVEGAGGEIRLETVSGRITAKTSAQRISARSTSGRVEVHNDTELVRGRITSVSGSLRLATFAAPDGEIELETVSGSGTIALGGDLDLRLEIFGGPGGDIRNRLDDTPVVNRGPGTGERLDARFGNSSGYVRASTVSGTLTIEGF
ncbi:MAG: DUF4097 family beta strand repeat-containing protein [Pseudomonadales bacterium]|nr:DUF4097 family beta strand repeat protein [Pseudomonadales bacterium]